MSAPDITHLKLPDTVKIMARMAAARQGTSLSAYVATLIHEDANRTGIAGLVVGGPDGAEEVRP